MVHLRYILAIFSLFILISTVSSLDIVKPSTYDGNTLALYPGLKTTIEFLKVESGTDVFVDSINCDNLVCGTVNIYGPYYVFDVSPTNADNGKITINYHLKGQTIDKKTIINVSNKGESLTAVVLMPTEAQFYQETDVTVVAVNNSDLKLSGKVNSNFPSDVFVPVEFSLEPKTKKEFKTQFYPKNPGYYDISYFLNIDGIDQKVKIGTHTVSINRNLKDFLSLPTKSYFPTNPVLYLYSSIVYFVSLLA